jgi:uridine kinase
MMKNTCARRLDVFFQRILALKHDNYYRQQTNELITFNFSFLLALNLTLFEDFQLLFDLLELLFATFL